MASTEVVRACRVCMSNSLLTPLPFKKTVPALIITRLDPTKPPGIGSKYQVQASIANDAQLIFNVNADIAFVSFSSTGASNGTKSLTCTYTSLEQLTGFSRFKGTIGERKINITLDNGMTISGPLEGGPSRVQTFIGGGSWLLS